MDTLTFRHFLVNWQFWLLELLFVVVVVTTIVEASHLAIRRHVVFAGLLLGAGAWFLSSTVAPKTSRIYYDEQIYQGVAHNLTDLHRLLQAQIVQPPFPVAALTPQLLQP